MRRVHIRDANTPGYEMYGDMLLSVHSLSKLYGALFQAWTTGTLVSVDCCIFLVPTEPLQSFHNFVIDL